MRRIFSALPAAVENARRIADACRLELPSGVSTLLPSPPAGNRRRSVSAGSAARGSRGAFAPVGAARAGASSKRSDASASSPTSSWRTTSSKRRGAAASPSSAAGRRRGRSSPTASGSRMSTRSPTTSTSSAFSIRPGGRRRTSTSTSPGTGGTRCSRTSSRATGPTARRCSRRTSPSRRAWPCARSGRPSASPSPRSTAGPDISRTPPPPRSRPRRKPSPSAAGCRSTASRSAPSSVSPRRSKASLAISACTRGIVVAPFPIERVVPLEPAAKGVLVTQCEMRAAEAFGLVKIDLLGQRSLAVLGDALDLIEANRGTRPDVRDAETLGDAGAASLAMEGARWAASTSRARGCGSSLKNSTSRPTGTSSPRVPSSGPAWRRAGCCGSTWTATGGGRRRSSSTRGWSRSSPKRTA